MAFAIFPSHSLRNQATAIVLAFTVISTLQAQILFEKDVLPIVQARCLRCHGAEQNKAGLDLRNRAAMIHGGESGPALLAGVAEKSLLWLRIAGDQMPPGKQKLTANEKGILKAWIDAGARSNAPDIAAPPPVTGDRQVSDADRRFWAFRPPVRPAVPEIRSKERVRNPIDSFILAALEKKGLTMSPEADRPLLLRRASFSLIGLPPTPEEVEAFVNDPSPDAFEKQIDRLLASPRYGERWARHWLDVAGYADSEGILDADYPRSASWRYRDYVVRAFNSDKPYDRFLQEQIAGDELTDYWTAYQTRKELPVEVVEGLIATGYLRCASDTSRPDFANIKNAPGYYYQTLDDTLKIVASGVLGLTVQCARCHSHKYDPIPQLDYYRLQAIFMGAYRPAQWVPQVQRRLLEATAVQEKEAAALDASIARLTDQLNQCKQTYAERYFREHLALVPMPLRAALEQALNRPPAKRGDVEKLLALKFETALRPPIAELEAALERTYPEYAGKRKPLSDSLKAEQAKRKPLPEIRALYDLPGEVKTHLLRRGDYLNPGREVQPGVLSALSTPKPFEWRPPDKDSRTSKRRLAFAQWLTQPGHPLTARVIVNRLWLHHFGEGLVSTPDNFGKMGSAPSHPELLDYLATELVSQKWSLKAMHRLMLSSAVWRQAATLQAGAHDKARQVDPDNRLLWKQRLRRLEAEALRDAILVCSGSLNTEMYGPPVPMKRMADGEIVVAPDAHGLRRSIYLQVRRSQPLTLLQVFDQPVIETNCTRRGQSTVPAQALTLLNSEFLIGQADAMAGRLLSEKPADLAARALLLAFGRAPTQPEKVRLTTFLQAQTERWTAAGERALASRRALADLCHMLLCAAEFAFVD